MKLGLSLTPQLLLGRPVRQESAEFLAYYGSPKRMLQGLKDQGIHSIELRYLKRTTTDNECRFISDLVWEAGLELTVHGRTEGDFQGSRFGDVYPPMKELMARARTRQHAVMMPIHAYSASDGSEDELSARTVRLLREWLAMTEEGDVPVYFALELNRRKDGTIDPGSHCEGVLGMVAELGHSRAGITWDMGHYYANRMRDAGLAEPPREPILDLPPKAFLRKTIHTHIHGLGAKGTHCPLAEPASLPLEHYVRALQEADYRGIYHLELEFERFPADRPVAEHVAASIDRLREAVGKQGK